MKKVFVMLLIIVVLGWGRAAEAQQPISAPRVGLVVSGLPSAFASRVEAFRQGLRELGYVEGRNILIEYRSAEGEMNRLPDLFAELVRLKVDVIVTHSTLAVQRAKEATMTIPIVMTNTGDPVATGLVASLARPGGNVTGSSDFTPELAAKTLELLREAVPSVRRVAVLSNPANPSHEPALKETEAAARALRVELQLVQAREPKDLDSAFSAMRKKRSSALLVIADRLFLDHRAQIAAWAANNRLPTIFSQPEYVEAGGLMSYGVDIAALWRRAATFVDKILKGRKPVDLPVEQPMKFEFIINLKTAKQIRVTIPQWTLMKADRVIRDASAKAGGR